MGASDFIVSSKGDSVKKAFKDAVDRATEYYGNRGYTGSIAEKDSYVKMGVAATLEEAEDMAANYISEFHPKINDKWGPAGYIVVDDGTDTYVFFGYASS